MRSMYSNLNFRIRWMTSSFSDLGADELLIEIEMLDSETSAFSIGFERSSFDIDCATSLFSRCPRLMELHLSQLYTVGLDLDTMKAIGNFVSSPACCLRGLMLGPNHVAEGGTEVLMIALGGNISLVDLHLNQLICHTRTLRMLAFTY